MDRLPHFQGELTASAGSLRLRADQDPLMIAANFGVPMPVASS
jgi:hypothetical protein